MDMDDLIAAVRVGTAPTQSVDQHVLLMLLGSDRLKWRFLLAPSLPPLAGYEYASVTTSLDAARALLRNSMPGWIYRVADCSVSDDAWVIPDFSDPQHGKRFQEIFPHACQVDPLAWFGSDIDLRPSGRPAAALCIAMLTAHRKTQEWLAKQAAAAGSVQ